MVELYEGCWGRRRDGQVVGPFSLGKAYSTFPFTDGISTWGKAGNYRLYTDMWDIIEVYPSDPCVETKDTQKPLDDLNNLREENQRLRGLLWYGWREMNAIRAARGAPDGVCEEYWRDVVEAMQQALGDDAKPWPSEAARTALSTNPEAPNQ